MMRLRLGRWQVLLRTGMTFLAGGIVAACGPREQKLPELSAQCPRGRAPQTDVEVQSCLQGFDFDTTTYAGDAQPLAVIGTPPGPPCPGDPKHTHTCRYGPLAKIEPLIGAHKYSERDLREGRIIARLSIPSGETEGYPKYGLQPGQATYWWVQTDSTGSRGTSVFVTPIKDRKVASVTRRLVRYLDEGRRELKHAVARWIWSLEDETSQGRCGSGTCK